MSDGFLSRWSQRKLAAKSTASADLSPGANPHPSDSVLPQEAPLTPPVSESMPLPTEADLEQVKQGGDIAAFLVSKVSAELKNKAFKTLFSRPEFNQMDGLDIYIDDYNVFTPMTAEDVGKMSMSKQLLSRPDLETPVSENGLPKQDLVLAPETEAVEQEVAPTPVEQLPQQTDDFVQGEGIESVHPRVSPSEDSCGSPG